jgi:hypothetical protein
VFSVGFVLAIWVITTIRRAEHCPRDQVPDFAASRPPAFDDPKVATERFLAAAAARGTGLRPLWYLPLFIFRQTSHDGDWSGDHEEFQ